MILALGNKRGTRLSSGILVPLLPLSASLGTELTSSSSGPPPENSLLKCAGYAGCGFNLSMVWLL